jgi:hypothetical protein
MIAVDDVTVISLVSARVANHYGTLKKKSEEKKEKKNVEEQYLFHAHLLKNGLLVAGNLLSG